MTETRRHALVWTLLLAAACAHAGTPRTSVSRCAIGPADSVMIGGLPLHTACDVDEPAVLINPETSRPNYPMPTGEACVTATIRFVVDVRGVPEARTARIITTNDFPFAQAVLRSLPQWRYRPAMREGRPVRQLVTEGRGIVSQVVRVQPGRPFVPPLDGGGRSPC